MPAWTDITQAIASIASVAIALVSIGFIVASLRQTSAALLAQNRSTDVASVLSIFERLDDHWCRFRSANDQLESGFEFGQLISYYELSCRLFRDRVFQTEAAITLYQHLHDVLSIMLVHSDFKQRFDELTTHDDTFENIKWLCEQPRNLISTEHGKLTALLRIFKVKPAN